ncbi:MAG: hypothetical protein EBT20_11515, partial [Alphaproteobacteria bacterium]|nr:hypothetical protein [Alphaproteobacteria bacterium]
MKAIGDSCNTQCRILIASLRSVEHIRQLAKVKHGIYDRIDQESTQVGVGAQSLQPIMEHAVMANEKGSNWQELIITQDDITMLIDDYIKNNYAHLNNSIKTLMKFSFATKLEHENFNIYIVYGPLYEDDHKTGVSVTEIQKTNYLSEDIVSHDFIHNTNFFNEKVLCAVSYPGAQSDIMILPDPELGKAQRRIAIDIIAYDDNYLYLCEVKDQISKIKSDKSKLEKFIKDKKFSTAVKEFTRRYKLGNKELKLCLCFAVNSKEKLIEWINNNELENIDFICAFITEEGEHIIWT